jgi:hypothetical protein
MQGIDERADGGGLPSDYFQAQQECLSAWNEVVKEWISNGGAISGNLDETRQFIRKDNKSRLSLIFKRTWEQQLALQEGGPLSRQQLSTAFSSAIRTEVPEQCGSVVWIQDMFTTADDVVSTDAKNGLLMSAPVDAKVDDDRALSRWIVYDLLQYKGISITSTAH